MKTNAKHRKPVAEASGEIPNDVSKLPAWQRARSPLDPLTVKLPARRVTINLDQDILAIFKAEALRGGPPYQVAINQALRAYLHDRETLEQDRAVRLVLQALDDRNVVRKLRRVR